MAVLAACASTNFTTSTTWALVDGTSYLNSETGTETVTTAYSGTRSSAFTPGAITIDGLGVKLSNRTGTTGTVSVDLCLSSDNSQVAGTEVTVNMSDLPACTTAALDGGWFFFKFGSSVLLSAATAYKIEIKTSSGSQLNVYRDSTADNISRYLRTTTTQAPVAGDDLIITKEWTAAATGTARTVTMNETAATDYGSASTSLVTPSLSISQGGTLTYETSGSTNYLLQQSGCVVVYNGGTLSIGVTGGSEIPRTSTAILQFDCAADGDFGLTVRNGGTFNSQGLSRTSGKNIYYCLLNTDEAVNSTSFGVDTDTGWLDNDEIVLPSTSRTYSEDEKGALNGDAGASTLTVDGFAGVAGGLANAHSGTSPYQCEVANLTRNVTIKSVSSSAMSYVCIKGTATVDIDWTVFQYLGTNTTDKKSIDVQISTGSFDMQYSVVRDTESWAIVASNGSAGGSITISNNVFYNTNNLQGASVYTMSLGLVCTVQNNIFIKCFSGSSAGLFVISIQNLATDITFTGNRIASSRQGTTYGALGISISGVHTGTISNNVIHSNQNIGLSIDGVNISVNLDSFSIWRNGSTGLVFGDPSTGRNLGSVKISNTTLIANTTRNILIGQNSIAVICPYIILDTVTSKADSSFATTNGLEFTSTIGSAKILMKTCDFSSSTAHTTDILINGGNLNHFEITAINSLFQAATEITAQSSWDRTSYFRSHKHDQGSTTFKTRYRYGTIDQETTNRHTASGYAWGLTPNTASLKLILYGPIDHDTFKAAVNASSLVTIAAYVLKNAAYNGNAARLVLVGGIVGGIASDVTASYSKTTKTITNATNATPIVITSNSHGYANGDVVLIEGVGGNTAANGRFVVANQTANTFELTGSTGNGAYTSGGTANVYEQLIVTATPNEAGVVEFYVDCDGTAGSIYVDDVVVDQA